MQHLGSLHETLTSDGWQLAVKPLVKQRMDAAMLQLASVDRPKDVSDDILRGHISALSWVLELETRVNREIAEKLTEQETPTESPAVGSPLEPESTE